MTYGLLLTLLAVVGLFSHTQACGGCSGDPDTDVACITDTDTDTEKGTGTGIETRLETRTRQISCTQPYTCYTYRTYYYYWVIRIRKTCYRSAFCTVTETVEVAVDPQPDSGTKEHPCCDGYILTSTDQCTRCGRSKYTTSASSGGSTFIVGGQDAKANQYPFLVQLYSRYATHFSSCGGSIIADRWILTAAHCVHGSYIRYSYAMVGEHDKRFNVANEKGYQYAEIYTHPQYNPSNGVSNYDIALVKTSQDMEFNDDVQPACLPKGARSYLGEDVTVAGWGRTSGSSSDTPSILQHANFTVIDPKYCDNIRYKNIICAKGVNNNVCSGDSGGPMVHEKGGYMTVIGVAWWSIMGCRNGDQFGVTDVSQYIDWMKTIM